MVVMILEKVSKSLRGELTRWLIEPRAGVFVGDVSALVRDKLWEKCCTRITAGAGAVQIWTTNNEQGYDVRVWGHIQRRIVDYEGLKLVCVPAAQPTQ